MPRRQAGSLVPCSLWCARRKWLATCWKTSFLKEVAALPPLKSKTLQDFWFGYLISFGDIYRGQSFGHGHSMWLCGQWVMGYCFIRLCDYILLASQLSVKFKTFRCEAIGLFRFMRDSRVREINKATFPCRSPIVVYESMATLLAHS